MRSKICNFGSQLLRISEYYVISVISNAFDWLVCYMLVNSSEKLRSNLQLGLVRFLSGKQMLGYLNALFYMKLLKKYINLL